MRCALRCEGEGEGEIQWAGSCDNGGQPCVLMQQSFCGAAEEDMLKQSKLSAHFNQPHFAWQRPSIVNRRVQHAVARLKATAREEEDGTPPTSSGGGGAEGSSLRLSESSSSEEEGQWEEAMSDTVPEPIMRRPAAEGATEGMADCAQEVPWKMGKLLVAKTMVQKKAGNKSCKGIGKFYHTVVHFCFKCIEIPVHVYFVR